MSKKRVIFMGTPVFAAKILEHLVTFPIDICAVVTQMDKPIGRKQILTPTPVKVVALQHNLTVFQPLKVKELETVLKELNVDFIITCAYGQFLPQSILACASKEALNIHASLLPKYRGGAPIHWSIIKGECETGISLMRMIKAMDAGDVFVQKAVKITMDDTTSTLHDKLIDCAKSLCDEKLMDVLDDKITPFIQDESLVTFGYNIQSEDEHVFFNKKAVEVHNHIRGLVSWPVGYALLDGKRVKLFGSKISDSLSTNPYGTITHVDASGMHVCTLDNMVILTHVQLEGRKMYAVKDDVSYLSALTLKRFE